MKDSKIWEVCLSKRDEICSVSSMDMGVIHGGTEQMDLSDQIHVEIGTLFVDVYFKGSHQFSFCPHALDVLTVEDFETIDDRCFEALLDGLHSISGPKNTTIERWKEKAMGIVLFKVTHPQLGVLVTFY